VAAIICHALSPLFSQSGRAPPVLLYADGTCPPGVASIAAKKEKKKTPPVATAVLNSNSSSIP